MGHWLYRNIVEPGKLPLLLALGAFVVTFVVTRVITRLIRAGKGPFGNVRAGGLHIHHVVPGVVLTVAGGFGAVATSNRHGVGTSVFAVVFGVGAGLVLDEFALILHLDDVYWTEAGRKSVEVVVLTAALVGLVLAGFSPFGVNDVTPGELQDRGSVIAGVAVNFLFSLVALSKGKLRLAVFGAIVPFLALVAAVRLARPGSYWARRFYRHRPRARARADLRAYRHDRRWAAPRRALQDWIGGKPDTRPRALAPAAPGAGPDAGTDAGRGAASSTATALGRRTDPGSGTGTDPGTASGRGTDPGTGTASGPASGPGPEADPDRRTSE